MEAQGDEGTVRHRRKFVVLGTALPAASEARHSGHRLAPTGKGLPTRLPRSGLVQGKLCDQFQVRCTYGLMTTPLPEEFWRSGGFGERVCYGRDVQFCVKHRVSGVCPINGATGSGQR
jgi:hypothetical protein